MMNILNQEHFCEMLEAINEYGQVVAVRAVREGAKFTFFDDGWDYQKWDIFPYEKTQYAIAEIDRQWTNRGPDLITLTLKPVGPR